MSQEQCKLLRKDFNPRETQFCAGELGKDACRGDSGGGVFFQGSQEAPWYVIGIVSFGDKNCGYGRPGVYTNITALIPWIKTHMV